MRSLRRSLLRAPRIAALLVGIALAMRMLVPGGFMPVARGDGIVVAICSGSGPRTIALPGPHAAPHGGHGHEAPAAAHDAPCAFAGLALPSLDGGDVPLLPAPAGFGRAPVPPAPRPVVVAGPPRLRPPLRGPPALA